MESPESKKDNLASALLAVQKELIQPLKKEKKGHVGNKYLDWDSLASAVKEACLNNDLIFSIEMPSKEVTSGEITKTVTYLTVSLTHVPSGEQYKTPPTILYDIAPPNFQKNGAQGAGSTITYMSRYVVGRLFAISGCDDSDDDGRKSHNSTHSGYVRRRPPLPPEPTDFEILGDYTPPNASSKKNPELGNIWEGRMERLRQLLGESKEARDWVDNNYGKDLEALPGEKLEELISKLLIARKKKVAQARKECNQERQTASV